MYVYFLNERFYIPSHHLILTTTTECAEKGGANFLDVKRGFGP